MNLNDCPQSETEEDTLSDSSNGTRQSAAPATAVVAPTAMGNAPGNTLAACFNGTKDGGIFIMADAPAGFQPGHIKWKKELSGEVYVQLRSLVAFALSTTEGVGFYKTVTNNIRKVIQDINDLGEKRFQFTSDAQGKKK